MTREKDSGGPLSSWLVDAPAPAPATPAPSDDAWVPAGLRVDQPAPGPPAADPFPAAAASPEAWIADTGALVVAAPAAGRRRFRRTTGKAPRRLAGLIVLAAAGLGVWVLLTETDDKPGIRITAAPPAAGTTAREADDARSAQRSRLEVAEATARRAAVLARRASARRVAAGRSAGAGPTPRRVTTFRPAPSPVAPRRGSTPATPPTRSTPPRDSSPAPSTPSSPAPAPATGDPIGAPPSSQPGREGDG